MILSPASRPVHALIPNDVMPKWWRTGRQGSRPSLISSMSSRRAIAYSLMGTSRVIRRGRPDRLTPAGCLVAGVGREIPIAFDQIVQGRASERPAPAGADG